MSTEMKLGKNFQFKFTGTLDQEDINQARALQQLTEHPGWKILLKYYEVGREQILDAGKAGTRDVEKKALSSERWALLDGFDQCSKIPEIIVRRAEEFLADSNNGGEENEPIGSDPE